jgi:hypothetical protein
MLFILSHLLVEMIVDSELCPMNSLLRLLVVIVKFGQLMQKSNDNMIATGILH